MASLASDGIANIGAATTSTIAALPDILLLGHNTTGYHSGNISLQDVFNATGTTMNADVEEDVAGNYSGPVFTTPTYILVWVTMANLLVLVTGLVGNALVIVVVTCVRDMRTPTNLCLMNLSVADLLVLLICQPSSLLEFYAQEKWMLGDFMCELRKIFMLFLFTTWLWWWTVFVWEAVVVVGGEQGGGGNGRSCSVLLSFLCMFSFSLALLPPSLSVCLSFSFHPSFSRDVIPCG